MELEFKAWHKEYKVWLEGELLDALFRGEEIGACGPLNTMALSEQKKCREYYQNINIFKHPDWEVVRYTGRKDDNGKKIFEGDKVKATYCLNNSSAIGIVKMTDGCWCVSFEKFAERPFCPTYKIYRNSEYLKMFSKIAHNKCEVVGHKWSHIEVSNKD